MRPRVVFAAALGAVLLSLPGLATAQLYSLETKDLRLIYNRATLSSLAPYAARCFENSMQFHHRLFGYTPSEKVNVFLEDFADYGNAGVWVNPRNSMVVQIAPSNFVYETGPSNERINFTMNHEVVHVVALDQAAGSDKFFRWLFRGKVRETSDHPESIIYQFLCLPRRASPRWYHEGVAVFFETWMAGGLGRAQGPYDEMVFRSMVRDGSRFYDPLGLESEGTKIDFQVGVNSYLYGTRFVSYLAHEYSPESLIQWVSRSPGSRRYFASQFRNVYGLSLSEAWRNWVEWEHRFQQANLDSIRLHRTTPSRDLSERALGSVSRAFFAPESRTLYAAVDYPGTVAHIAAIPLDGGPVRNLREVKGPALYFVCSLAYDPLGKTLFYTTDNNEWRDLCSLDPATGRSHVLIKNARIGDLAFNPADSSLWGVRHLDGISTLVRIPYPHKESHQVFSWPYGKDPYDIDVSPDGSMLCASLSEISGRQTLRLMKTQSLLKGDTTSTTLYDFGNAIPASFVFSPDGKYLYGSSYYTAVSNIFRYDLAGDSMSVVSNCETGFFRPVPISGDSLIVFRYTGEGFVPALIKPEPLQEVSAVTYLGERIVEKYPVVKRWIVPSPASVNIDSLTTYSGRYKGLGQIALTSVYPVVEGYKDFTGMGLRIDFSDPIATHAVDFSATYTPAAALSKDERLHLTLNYRRYDLSAHLKLNGASFYDLVGPTKTARKGYSAGLEYKRPLIYDLPRSLELSAGLTGYGGLERLPDAQNVSTSPGFDKLVAANTQLDFKNLRASIGAVDHEKGYRWQIAASSNTVRFQRAGRAAWRGFPLMEAAFDVGTPLPLRNSSLWLRTAGGYSPGDRNEPFSNFFFGGFGNNWVDYQDVKRYRQASSFPGVDLDEIAGTNYAKALIDWNLPPLRFRRVGKPSFYATWTRVSLFGSGIVTNMDSAADRQTLGDLGVQADVRLTLLVQQPLTISVGYARAFERHRRTSDEWMVSLKIL